MKRYNCLYFERKMEVVEHTCHFVCSATLVLQKVLLFCVFYLSIFV